MCRTCQLSWVRCCRQEGKGGEEEQQQQNLCAGRFLGRGRKKKKGGVGLPVPSLPMLSRSWHLPTSNIAFTQQTTVSSRKKGPVHSSETALRQREAVGGAFILPNGLAISCFFCFRFV